MDEAGCVKHDSKQLILLCARRVLRDRELGNYRDAHQIAWAEWIVRHNGSAGDVTESQETPSGQ